MSSNSGQLPNSVEVVSLSRRYGRRWALVDVSFTVPRGTAIMVAGRNGSGKSTLLRVLSTALRPDGGTARLEGYDIRRQRHQVRERVAILGHASYTYDAMTALENLQLVARLMGKDASRDAVMPLLEEVGLGERSDDNILSFSAGMRKRISIARVLLQDAQVVMLDEPYGQLDPPGFRFVDKLFTKLRDRGVTIMMATHLLDRGAALCDLGVVLERGRLQWAGDAKDLPRLGGLDPASTPEGAQ